MPTIFDPKTRTYEVDGQTVQSITEATRGAGRYRRATESQLKDMLLRVTVAYGNLIKSEYESFNNPDVEWGWKTYADAMDMILGAHSKQEVPNGKE
jgi:hypothetical protein